MYMSNSHEGRQAANGKSAEGKIRGEQDSGERRSAGSGNLCMGCSGKTHGPEPIGVNDSDRTTTGRTAPYSGRRIRPETSGGILRQLIQADKDRLALIEIERQQIESRIANFEVMLDRWEKKIATLDQGDELDE